jgi:hypothetical protein
MEGKIGCQHMMEWPVIAIKVDNNPVPVSLPVSLQKRVRHHHHGLVMSLIPGGGNLESVCGYELACGESHSKFFNVIVITFTNKVNAQKPIITAFAHKRCF